MLSATLDLNFTLPNVHPLEKPMAFTAAQLLRLRNWGHDRAASASHWMQRTLQRIEDLRGTSVAWVAGLSLGELVTWSVKNARGSVSSLPAPLTIFKPQQHLWVPKVVLRVCPEVQIEAADMTAYHTTCRRGSMEFLAITHEQIAGGYLDSKHFKRAFNGAFFCDRLTNTTIFCPTLRDWGFFRWPEASIQTELLSRGFSEGVCHSALVPCRPPPDHRRLRSAVPGCGGSAADAYRAVATDQAAGPGEMPAMSGDGRRE